MPIIIRITEKVIPFKGKLHINEIPVDIIDFKNENEELERLLIENQYREKTIEQKMREGLLWEVIEKEKAKLRQGERNDLYTNIPDHGQECYKGETSDIIAEKVGLGSGTNLPIPGQNVTFFKKGSIRPAILHFIPL